MLILGFTSSVFLASMVYILIERKGAFYKSRQFWWLLLGFLLSALMIVLWSGDQAYLP